MPWHDSTVPGRGWIDLRAVTSRSRLDYVFVVAEVRVSTEDPIYANYPEDSPNMVKVQRAIMGRLRTATVVRGSIQRRARLLVRMTQYGPGLEGWLDFWSETLGVNVLSVKRWDVTHPPTGRKSTRRQ